jgi:hypothetical protein
MANVFIGFGLLRCSHQGSDLIPFLDLATRASSRMTPSHISHHYPVGDPWGERRWQYTKRQDGVAATKTYRNRFIHPP